MKKRLFSLVIILTLIISTMVTTEAFGASASASMSGGSCQVGQNVNVTLTYRAGSGASLGAAQFNLSYNSNILEYKSVSGPITMQSGNTFMMEATGSSTMTCTFTFRAKAAGSASVSVSTISGMLWEPEEGFSASPAPVTVTVTAPPSSSSSSSSSSSGGSGGGTVSKKPVSNTGGRGEFTESSQGLPEDEAAEAEEEETVDPSVKPEEIEVTLGEKIYIICEDLEDEELPEGFSIDNAKYGEYEWKIPVLKNPDSKYVLILLKDKETGEKAWFFYDEKTGAMTDSASMTVEEALEYERLVKEGEKTDLLVPYIITTVILLAAIVALIIKQRKTMKEPD